MSRLQIFEALLNLSFFHFNFCIRKNGKNLTKSPPYLEAYEQKRSDLIQFRKKNSRDLFYELELDLTNTEL